MENIPRLRKLMDEDEQNEKIESLEEDFKELHEKLEELQEERGSEKEGTPDFEKLVIRDRPFVVHWVEDTEYSTITTEAEAEAVFLAAALARDNTSGKLPVSHGDFMVIGTDCAWLAVCLTVDGMLQREDPHAPEVAKSEVVTISSQSVVRREFMVWNACSEYSCPECPLPISTLGDSSTWAVSLGTCTKFDDLMSVSAVTGSEGTTLTFKKREFSINSCGEVVSISAESDVDILIPCCSSWDDPCEDDVSIVYKLWWPTGSSSTCGLAQDFGGTRYLPFYELSGTVSGDGTASGGPSGVSCGLQLFTGTKKSRSGSGGACEVGNWSFNGSVTDETINPVWIFPDGTWQWQPTYMSAAIQYTSNQSGVLPAGQTQAYYIETLTIG